MSIVRYMKRPLIALSIGLAAFITGGAAQADTYPSKPIQFVVPYPPGGPLDIMARLLAQQLKDDLGTLVVENKAGAGGNIGASLVAKAKPDGYSLVMGAVAINAINPWLYSSLPFDPVKSFEPVALVASVPNVLVVNPAFADANQITNVADLLDYAQRHPGELNFASGGNGSAGHLAGALMNSRADVNTVHVPYAGASPAKTALLAGEVHFMFDNLASAAPLIKDGQLKALAVTTSERSSFLNDVPTMEEAGVADFDLGTWFGVFATGGTAPEIVEQLNTAYNRALQKPKVREALSLMGSEAKALSAPEFAQMVKSELDKYKDIVAASGAQLY